MICLEVRLNDERLALAGVGALGVLNAMVNWVAREGERPELSLEVGGLDHDAHLRWVDRGLKVGDRIEVTLVESSSPDPPARQRRDDASLVERAERKYYEHLKGKYE